MARRQLELSLGRRSNNFDALTSADFDILVVGGGITGCGIALEAAARGLRTGLVEAGDIGSGTSSRSSKLIHGGLRYLQYMEFQLTSEASAERRLLQRLAPGIVRPLPFVLPAYGLKDALRFELGLWLYDAVAGFRNTSLHRSFGARRSSALFPTLRRRGLTRTFHYYDAVTDDVRLTLQVAKVASSLGAVFVNYAKVVGFLREGDADKGVMVRDLLGGQERKIRARKVILACGVWVDELLALDDARHEPMVVPAKGVTLVVKAGGLPQGVAFAMPVASDGRLVFAIPWYDRVLISATDTPYRGDLARPPVDANDVEYLLAAANAVFPDWGLTRGDVVAAQAGLRPLIAVPGRATEDLSRRERYIRTRSGLLAIAGGKLTTYRPIARRVVDAALRELLREGTAQRWRESLSAEIPLAHRIGTERPLPTDAGGAEGTIYLQRTYGSDGAGIMARAKEAKDGLTSLIPERPYIEQEVRYAVAHELAVEVTDFLARRVRAVLLDGQNGLGCAARVADLMGAELGWDEAKRSASLSEYEGVARAHTLG